MKSARFSALAEVLLLVNRVEHLNTKNSFDVQLGLWQTETLFSIPIYFTIIQILDDGDAISTYQ